MWNSRDSDWSLDVQCAEVLRNWLRVDASAWDEEERVFPWVDTAFVFELRTFDLRSTHEN